MARRKPSDEVVEAIPAGASMQAVTENVPTAPVAVMFVRPFGFIDEHGDRWHWNGGDIVRNPYVLSLLMERAAPIHIVEDAA